MRTLRTLFVLLLLPVVPVAGAAPSAAAAGTEPVQVSVEVSQSPVTEGEDVVASVTVTARAGAAVPGGQVRFTLDGQDTGQAQTLLGGQASVPVTGLAVGAHQVGVRYAGDDVFGEGDAGPGTTVLVAPRGAGRFVPTTPSRVLDTRPGAAQTGYSGPSPAARSTVVLQVGGRGGVAGDAVAVALNVTATTAAASGFVTVWPSDQPRPLASNLNVERPGDTIANLVVVPLSADGRVSLYTSGGTDLLADVAGFFAAARTSAGGRLVPLTPARILDTRAGTRPAARSTVTAQVAGRGGVPASADGVVLNVTATSADSGGFFTVWPTDQPRPVASVLNTTHADQTIPNAVWVPLAANGTVSVYTHGAAHVVVDVAGWFTGEEAPDTSAGLYVPTPPTRLLDTRPGAGQTGYSGGKPAANSTVPVTITGRAPVPARNVAAVVANLTATEVTGAGFVTAYPAGTERPLASSLNVETAGQTRPNLLTLPLGDGALRVYTKPGAHFLLDVAGYFLADLDAAATPVQHETYDPAAGTTMLDPAAVSAVTGDSTAGYQVTIVPGAARPATGAGLVLKGGGTAYPDGLAGKVTAVTPRADGSAVLAVTATPMDELFDSLSIDYSGPADVAPVGTTRRAADVSTGIDASVIQFGAGAFECSAGPGVEVSAALVRFENTRVRFEKRAGLLTTPYLHLSIQTEPVVEFAAEVHGKVTCELSAAFRRTHRLVWVLPTQVPVTVDLAPAFRFEATVAAKATFTVRFFRMIGFETNPDLSLHVFNGASQRAEGVDLSGELSVSLLIGADLSVKLLDVVGVGLTFGPEFTGSVDDSLCLRLTAALRADFDLRVDLWVKQLKSEFLTVRLGPWTVAESCPPGASALRVASSALPSASAGAPYSARLSAYGGTRPYTWEITELPAGLTANAAGYLGGTPTTPGGYNLRVVVTDAAGNRAEGGARLDVIRPQSGQELAVVSVTGGPLDQPADYHRISGDGRWLYFHTAADNAAPGPHKSPSVYLRDRVAGTNTRLDIPAASGPANRLRAASTNGRFALITGTDANHQTTIWRYDRNSGAMTQIVTNLNVAFNQPWLISNDGDLVRISPTWLMRVSTGAVVPLTCPGGIGQLRSVWSATMTGSQSVYFTADGCDRSQVGVYRYSVATGTSVYMGLGSCGFNAGNTCAGNAVATSTDSMWAGTRLQQGSGYGLYVNGNGPIARGLSLALCGVTEDAMKIVFATQSALLPDGGQGWDVFMWDGITQSTTRLSPVGSEPSEQSWCGDGTVAGAANLVTYYRGGQIYARSTVTG